MTKRLTLTKCFFDQHGKSSEVVESYCHTVTERNFSEVGDKIISVRPYEHHFIKGKLRCNVCKRTYLGIIVKDCVIGNNRHIA